MIKTYNNDDVIENYENFKPQNIVKNVKLPKAKTVAKVGAGVAVAAGTGYLIHNTINNCQASGGCATAFRANTVRLDKDATIVRDNVAEGTKNITIDAAKKGANTASDVMFDAVPLLPLFIAIGVIIFIIFLMYFYR